ncbi:hypothetical protein [uncultured Alsobacter sp.]|uniref:hypothetical protein n=1 Tax=uncultured Alsobacter sp. TaxID=1748258 RepID=UPI0025F17F05|nr:hypothetical protein [uncultured Alsobacter sp.]
MPARSDLDVWKGNTFARTFRLTTDDTTPLDLTGSVFVFRVVDSGAEIIRYESGTDDELAVPTPANGEVNLLMPVAGTRTLPEGSVARYELERRIGLEQTTLLYGLLVVTGWANDDA